MPVAEDANTMCGRHHYVFLRASGQGEAKQINVLHAALKWLEFLPFLIGK